jgi:hypothetical protein
MQEEILPFASVQPGDVDEHLGGLTHALDLPSINPAGDRLQNILARPSPTFRSGTGAHRQP